MDKRLTCRRAVCCLLAVFFTLPGAISGALGKLEVGYSAPPEVTRAMLYVNGRYKGFMYRNRTLAVMVETGRSHVVRVFRQEGGHLYQKTEVVRFGPAESSRSITLTLQKKIEKSGGQLRLRLDALTPFESARFYAGGNLLGTVYKSRTVSFDLPAGPVAVEVRRIWQGKSWRYAGRLQIARGDNQFRIVALKLQGDLGPDLGRQGSALLRIKLEKTSPMPSASLYLGARLLGTVYRDKYSNYNLEAGQARLQVRCTWNGSPWKSPVYNLRIHSGRRIYLLVKMQPG